jgi:hypothetical protein
MGRKPWSNRLMVEDCRSTSILEPKIKMAVKHFEDDSYYLVTLRRSDSTVYEQRLYVTKIPGHFGGWRFYYLCPKCDRKVIKLYLALPIKGYACRECHNLTYRSQKKRNGFQERFLMGFTGNRKQAWELLDSLHK